MGKGTVLAYEISKLGKKLIAFDSDKNRHNLYLEASGVQVFKPSLIPNLLKANDVILVANPNHLPEIRASAPQGPQIFSVSEFSNKLMASLK